MLVACGGGGGGDGSSQIETNTFDYGNGESTISYSGKADPADISLANSVAIVSAVFGSDVRFINVSAKSPITKTLPNHGFLNQTRQWIRKISRAVDNDFKNTFAREREVEFKQNVEDFESCDSGSLSTTGTLYNDGTAHLELLFDFCQTGNEILNGLVLVRVDEYDADNSNNLLDYTIFLPLLTSTISGVTSDISGFIDYDRPVFPPSLEQIYNLNLVTRDTTANRFRKLENFVFVDIVDSFENPTTNIQTISGRILHSEFGALDVQTLESLFFDPVDAEFPNTGQLLIIGAANAKLRVNISEVRLADTILELDLDGNDIFEAQVSLFLSQLEDPINASLADDDSDGIHNSWETVNGLDPNDASDANLDTDGDGFFNFEEYQGGSNPNDSNSEPQHADLEMLLVNLDDEIFTGEPYFYRLVVLNNGPNNAYNLTLQLTLPPGVVIDSIGGAGGSSNPGLFEGWECNHSGNSISCSTPVLDPGNLNSVVVINAYAPTSVGSITHITSLSTETLDPNLNNDTDSESTAVVLPYVDLEIVEDVFTSDLYVLNGSGYTNGINLRNLGPKEAVNVVVTNTLPANVSFVSYTSTGFPFDCNHSAGIVTCTRSSLPVSAGVDIEITAMSNSSVGYIASNTTATSDSLEHELSNNSVDIDTFAGIPATSVQVLINEALPGDTVLVPPGNYIGSVDFNGKDITLQSRDGVSTVWFHRDQGGLFNYAMRAGPGAEVREMTFTGHRGLALSGDNTVVEGNVFDGFGKAALALTGGTTPTIVRNLFTNYAGGTVLNVGGNAPLITNNLFINNTANAIEAILPDGNTPMVINNTFVGNQVAISMHKGQNGQIYRNNIIAFNDAGLKEGHTTVSGENLVWENNLVFGNGVNYDGISDQSFFNGNLNSDPIFIDSLNLDLGLQIGSPAIDTGNSSLAPADDYNGNPRPLDGDGDLTPEYDIGAFEAPAL